ncbi:MAG TPA: FtsX-like permease family protein [Dictyobacter sp.]|nr:FtsX-like permease family protein [Dictyobacter sp.]
MKVSMYFNYTSRSLVRGGQRTLLAIFCVAVGVMAIVALQLVGLMINNAFTSNVRAANGGDIQVRSQNQPFVSSDLTFFANLKNQGAITNYTPVINAQGTTGTSVSLRQSFTVRVVDPANYPVVTPPTFVSPRNETFSSLLKNNQIVVTQSFINQYKKQVGDTLSLHVGTQQASGRTLNVKLAGVISETGVFDQAGSVVVISERDYQAAAPKLPVTYDTIDITAPSAQINNDVRQIQNQFPIANTQTAADALKQEQATINNVQNFLEIAGLLALLIGGVGIVNTMQVLLSRRKTEIAMLKTTGYRRFDLYLLFGLEAGLLGLTGGVVGAAAATGVSYLVRNLVVQTFGLNIPFLLSWSTIGGGVVIGLVTALIFGLLPIVQAANIRPLNVIRDLSAGRGAASIALTVVLLIILSVLFCLLAIIVLNGNVVLGIASVYGTFLFLGILSLFLGLIIFLLSRMPVLERFTFWYLLVMLALFAISAALYFKVPDFRAFGVLLFVISCLLLLVVIVPRTWKAMVKMALRNLGRQRARTTTTMLALFVGIFTIGLILVLGQNLRTQVNTVIGKALNYNVYSITDNSDTTKLQHKLSSLSGLSAYQIHSMASTVPVAINNQPIQQFLPQQNTSSSSAGTRSRNVVLYFLSGVEGYDVGHNQIPSMQSMTIVKGHNLTVQDAGTNDVLVSNLLQQGLSTPLKVGDTITLASSDRKHTQTVTIVGFYQQTGFGSNLEPIIGTTNVVKGVSPTGVSEAIFYMKIDPNKLSSAVDEISRTVPNAFVLNLSNISNIIDQILNDILLTLTTIASLSLLAGIIIIANAVALAMLERRRELGILKSVGYTSSSILSEVLVENGIVGGVSALVAMLLVTFITSILGTVVFNAAFGVSSITAVGLIAGATALAMLAAIFVAWGAVRVRPLEVLRYE